MSNVPVAKFGVIGLQNALFINRDLTVAEEDLHAEDKEEIVGDDLVEEMVVITLKMMETGQSMPP